MIDTIKDLVKALGGNALVAKANRVGPPAISNWIAFDSLPLDKRPVFARLCERYGMEVDPRFFAIEAPDMSELYSFFDERLTPVSIDPAKSNGANYDIPLTRLQRIVFDAIQKSPMTDHEGVASTRLNPSTYRARRSEIARVGLVVDSGSKRETKPGFPATVWRAHYHDGPI